MKESHEIGVVQRKQLKMIIENFKINNRKLYKSCKVEPISQSTQINKWKILWHFEIPESSRKYQGKTRKAFVVYIYDILRNALKNGATAAAKQLVPLTQPFICKWSLHLKIKLLRLGISAVNFFFC